MGHMTETITPAAPGWFTAGQATIAAGDLRRFQTAKQEAHAVEVVLHEAEQKLQVAVVAYQRAVGAMEFVKKDIQQEYGIQPGDQVDEVTGVITRATGA